MRGTIRLGLISAWLVASMSSADAADVVVSAAASLSNAFTELGKTFDQMHPDDRIIFNFAASDVLLKQIEQGAPADVFASADEVTMDRAAQSHLVDAATRHDFAANTLVLIVADNVKTPTSLAELTTPTFAHIAVGNPDSVPAGRYAKEALDAAKLWQTLQPQIVPTQNVRAALDYVSRGEAQAGFVYATDAATQKDKVHVAMTVATATPIRYPLAVTSKSAHADPARAFVDFVVSPSGQAVLARYGFSKP